MSEHLRSCSLTELQMYRTITVFHVIFSHCSQYKPLHTAHIITLFSPHITQHGKVCMSVKLRVPLLKQSPHRQLPAAQRRPMHYSCSFTQPPISLSWVHRAFIAARCTAEEHCWNPLEYDNLKKENAFICVLMDMVMTQEVWKKRNSVGQCHS